MIRESFILLPILLCSPSPAEERLALRVNESIEVQIAADAPDITTDELRKHPDFGPLRGATVDLQIDEPGVHTIEARAISCDAYLILRDPEGNVLAEDDESYVGTQPRVVIEFSRAGTYRIEVGSWRGWSGPCSLHCRVGRPPDRSPAERRTADLRDAEACAREAAARFGDRDARTGWSVHGLARRQQAQGLYRDAEATYRTALAIREEALGEDHRDSIESLHSLGVVLNRLGRSADAEDVHRRAFARRERSLGRRHPDTAQSLNGIGVAIAGRGHFGDAERYFRDALEIHEQILGTEHRDTAATLFNIAESLTRQLRWSEAEDAHRRVLDVRERVCPNEPAELGSSRVGLGSVLIAQGRIEEGTKWLSRGHEVLSRGLGSDHPATISAAIRFGMGLTAGGHPAEAEALLRQAVDALDKSGAVKSLPWAQAASALGVTLVSGGRIDEGEDWLRRSLDARTASGSAEQFESAGTLAARAAASTRAGRFDEAEADFRRALSLYRGAPSTLDSCKSFILDHLVWLCARRDRIGEAITIQRDLFAMHIAQGIREAAVSPRDLRASAVTQARREIFRLLSLEGDRLAAFDAVAACKGLAFRIGTAARRATIAEGTSEHLDALLREDRNLSGEMSLLAYGRSAVRADERRARLEALRERRRSIEREIAQLREVPSDSMRVTRLGLERRLDEDAAYVDVFVWTPFRFPTSSDPSSERGSWQPARVAAWVIRNGQDRSAYVDLGPVSALDTILLAALDELARGARGKAVVEQGPGESSAAMSALREALWDPLVPHLAGVTQLFVAPEGLLAELPLDAIEIGHGRPLIESMNVTYISDPGTLLELLNQPPPPRASSPSLLVVGGVAFDRSADGKVGLATEIEGSSPSAEDRGFSRRWAALPATRVEVEAVSESFQRFQGGVGDVVRLTGPEPSEEAIKQRSPGRTLLHFATHGFYQREGLQSIWSAQDAESTGTDDAFLPLASVFDAIPERRESSMDVSPGFLTGLVFAGVNGSPLPGREDGILTADEVERLDLTSCELAVLSACETALGVGTPGEGLNSLRRAFASAGARSVVSTLWRVGDEATLALMTEFYRRFLDERHPPATALRGAKLHLLRHTEWKEPRYWAAFTLAGDWR